MRAGALRRLLAACGVDPAAEGWLREVLGAEEQLPGCSTLNHDGAPVQVCCSVGAGGERRRLVVDPGYACADRWSRYHFGAATLLRLAPPSLRDALTQLLERAGPAAPAELRRSPGGTLWLAGLPGQAGIAAYLDLGRAQDPWSIAARWLEEALPDPAPAQEAIAALRPVGVPASVALEGSTPDDLRAKIYWRLGAPALLGRLGGGWYEDAIFAPFLRVLLGGRAVRLQGLVFGLGFSVATGALADRKIDVCCCPACRPGDGKDRLAALEEAVGFDLLPLAERLARPGVAPAFVGLGASREGATRLNLYLAPAPGPRWRSDPAPGKSKGPKLESSGPFVGRGDWI